MKIITAGKWVLLLSAAFFTLTSMMSLGRVNFSGEWKLNESKSEPDQFPICIFGSDRMRCQTMKITAHAGFLAIDGARTFSDGGLVIKQAKLEFNSKEGEITFVGNPRVRSAATWSHDGQTMTVHSIRSFDTNCKTPDFNVTEVWKLINRGKSIAIRVTSISTTGPKTMRLVFDKQ